MSEEAKCYDCGLPYAEFGLDMHLPAEQWRHLFPEFEGSGLLCANCICRRADKLQSATVLLVWIDSINWQAPRPAEWFTPRTETPTAP